MKDSNPIDDPLRPHEYDGIQEYDNQLPNWWLFTLYGSIAFSIAYWIFYHKSDLGPTQEEEYQLAVAALEAKQSSAAIPGGESQGPAETIDSEGLWALAKKDSAVSSGQSTYAAMCASCHGQNLEGGIGVSLIDSEWIHGDDPMAIRGTIVNGVLEKGMPAWLPVIGEMKVNEVTAFILSHHD